MSTQTIETIPLSDTSFLADLQEFLRDEDAGRTTRQFHSYIWKGGAGGISGTITHTVSACEAFCHGYYVSSPDTAHTYGGNTETYVYIHQDSTTPDAATIEASLGGGDVTRAGHLLFVEYAAGGSPDTPPEISGAAPLQHVTTNVAAITAVVDWRHRILTEPETHSASRTCAEQCVWIFRPGGRLDPQAGVTLTLGQVVAERYQIFTADEVNTGIIRFAGSAPKYVFPEWWGIDPFGLAYSKAQWNAVFAATANRCPILCAGVYRLVTVQDVDQGLTLVDGTQLIGFQSNTNGESSGPGAIFECYGPGEAIMSVGVKPYGVGTSRTNIVLRNLMVRDMEDTGFLGIGIINPYGCILDTLYVEGFEIAYGILGQSERNLFRGLYADDFRLEGLLVTGPALCYSIQDVYVDSNRASVFAGINFGEGTAVWCEYGVSEQMTITGAAKIASETAIPFMAKKVHSLDARLCLHYTGGGSPTAAMAQFRQINGASCQLWIDGGNLRPTAISLVPTDEVNNPANRNINFTGGITGITTTHVSAAAGPQWGINVSSLDFDPTKLSVADYVFGHLMGSRYITQGDSAPLVDEGRESWLVGDIVYNTAPASGQPYGWVCTVSGNPGTWIAITTLP